MGVCNERPLQFYRTLVTLNVFSRYKVDVLMAMFSAYFDASGNHRDSKVMTVAGFASTVEKWSNFDLGWNEVLHSEGIKVFRMTDFVSSQGEFAEGWMGKTARRKHFIERLCVVLKENVEKSFRTTLILGDWRQINQRFEIEEFLGRPYALCSMSCTFALRQWAKKMGAESTLLYYFEDGDADKGNFEQQHKSAYKVKPRFLEKAEAVGLQAGDFAGWKIRNSVQESIKDDHTLAKGIQLLQSVKMLQDIPKDAGVLNGRALAQYCRDWKVKVRR